MTTATASDATIDLRALQKTWAAFDRVAHLRPIRSDEEYDRAVALMNNLLDVVGDQEAHPLAGLLDLVSELVAEYESTHFAIEQTFAQRDFANQTRKQELIEDRMRLPARLDARERQRESEKTGGSADAGAIHLQIGR